MNPADILQRLQKTKTPLLILVCGTLLLLCTGRKSDTADHQENKATGIDCAELAQQEQRLEQMLKEIEGVGETHVLLSLQISAQTEYVTDGEKTLVLSSGSGRQEPVAERIRSPEYLGAVIVCDGGDDPTTRWNVTEAVCRFTGLRADQITVFKLR